jgi:hypothetical protein
MALNLIRNSRVFYTTNLKTDGSGQVAATGFTAANTREIQVQDGFSFSQNTGQETVTTNEAGITPIRGQRSFNSSLEPVDWSFSTYIRPKFEEGGTSTLALDADDFIGAEEAVLWNSLAGTTAIGGTGAGWTQSSTFAPPFATVAFDKSNAHQLHAFGLIIRFEDVTYVIDNCAIDSATIDFGLDAIASIAWAGKGTTMRQIAGTVTLADNTVTKEVTFGGTGGATGLTGVAKLKDTSAAYIANKLSTLTLASLAFGGLTAQNYALALTGGSLTITNNLTYLTPANLGVVNLPITYFTGTRAVTATLNCYLKTGTVLVGSTATPQSATLLKDMLAASASSTENKFAAEIALGGATNTTKVVLAIPTAQLTIPSITSEQIIATTINLTAQGAAVGGVYDIEATNELEVKYYATNTTI